jgi:capsular exopolysaccharide synthesis family protein
MPDNISGSSENQPEDPPEPSRELLHRDRAELERQAARFLMQLELPPQAIEEIQRLKNFFLREQELGRAGRILAITSSRTKEGVSFVAFHAAISLARGLENSVLLVDANFRRPSLHQLFRTPNTAGLSDILSAQAELHKTIIQTYMPYLAFLPSGPPPNDPGQLFRSDRFREFLAKLKDRFDYVIFDTPAVSESADSLVLGSKVDQVVLVTRAHHTKVQIVARVKEEIEKHGGAILGIILNRRKFFIPRFLYRHL